MNRLSVLAVSTALILLTACTGNEKNYDGEYADYNRVALTSTVEHVQPMTGIVLWNTHSKRDTDAVQLEFSYMLYNDVCKAKDVFDWTPMEKLLDEVASRGHQAVVRFRYTYVGKECSVPDYIKALPEYEETVGDSEGRTTFFPDWRCEELQRFHKEFHRRFAERYDRDPRLAFVQTGFGLWAEYHIYDGPFTIGRTFPSKEFQTEFIEAMGEWFDDTTWSISIDAADDTYAPFFANRALLDERFGNFDDSFMCSGHDGYNYRSWKFFGEERYKTAPFGGEFNYYTTDDQRHCLDTEGWRNRLFEDEVAKYHMTYIMGNDQPSYQTMERIAEAGMSMGYKFTVKDFRMKADSAAVLIKNTGVAPIYRDAYVAVGGKRGDYSLRNLMPDQEVWIEVNAIGSTETPAVAIECDHLVEGQKIEFEADIK